MPRKPSVPAGEAPNPLHQELGAFLRVSRLRRGQSTREVALQFDLTDTYYRLIEAGRASINPNLAFRVIEWLSQISPRLPQPESVSFPRLSLFLVGAQWVGGEMARNPRARHGETAFRALADRDTDFELLYARTRELFNLAEASDPQRQFLETVVAPEVGKFLQSEQYAGGTDESLVDQLMPRDELRRLPTLNLDLLLQLKTGLLGRPFVHTEVVAAEWEQRNSARFQRIRGLFRSAKAIVSTENLDRFRYWYLAQDAFAGIQFLFVDEDSPKKQRARFVELLLKARARHGEPALSERDIAKVRMGSVSRDDPRVAQILRLRPPNAPQHEVDYDAYWALQAHDGIEFGFLGVNASTREVWNLNLGESLTRHGAFDDLWVNADVV